MSDFEEMRNALVRALTYDLDEELSDELLGLLDSLSVGEQTDR